MNVDDEVVHPWTDGPRETVFRSRVFEITKKHSTEASGEANPRSGEFYVMETPDWVNVVALTKDGALVLVEQWRHGVKRTTLEIPGGMVDPGEGPAEAAKRELVEETGFVSDDWEPLGVIDPNPAIQSTRCYTYLAREAWRAEAPRFDEHERCRLVLVPYSDVSRLVASGRISHALVVVALHFARLREEASSAST